MDPIVHVDFRRALRGKLQCISPGVYKYQNAEGFYCRPVIDGQQRLYALKSIKQREAVVEWGKLQAQLAQYHAKLDKNPFVTSDTKTIKALCKFYIDQKCPRKNSAKIRDKQGIREETFRVSVILKWRGAGDPADEMTAEKWRAYKDWRIKNMIRRGKGGHRAVDKERVTLSNVFRCAVRSQSITGIKTNPMAHEVESFRDPDLVEHCREHMPRSGDELHSLGTAMLQTRRGEVLAWQMLMEACVGHRTKEILTLRWDAESTEQPGFIKGINLYLYRSASAKGSYGHIEIHSALRELLEAMENWHRIRYPAAWKGGAHPNAWFFPSPENPSKHVHRTSLTHRLKQIAPLIGQGKRSSHGMRAFYVNVRRSQGWTDQKISERIGHDTPARLIKTTYGEGLDYKLDWYPEKVVAAWNQWLPGAGIPRPVQLELL